LINHAHKISIAKVQSAGSRKTESLASNREAPLAVRRRSWIRIVDECDSSLQINGRSSLRPVHYEYDPYGQVTQTVGTLSADFQYAGYYEHGPSGLNLTLTRPYSPSLGRWISRDPAGMRGGINLYQYASNDPINLSDPSGLWAVTAAGYDADPTTVNCVGYACGIGSSAAPGPGQTFGQFISSLPGHVTCTAIPTGAAYSCNCKCPQHPFYFVFKTYGGAPTFTGGSANTPFHAFTGGFQEISGPRPLGTDPSPAVVGGQGLQEGTSDFQNNPAWQRYCCCSDNAPNNGSAGK
jgi:RHS repeat-associated protein